MALVCATAMNNQPIVILPDGTQRTSGRNAQRNNILAAKLVAETVRTTLGPKGMDKMLVDSLGNVTVTNDGVTILEEMHIEHPAAKMVVAVARTQETEVGDGTTTAVILAGELLTNGEKLLDQKIHPTVIVRGYRLAAQAALAHLEKISTPVSLKDRKILERIAGTAMTGKGAEAAKETLATLAVDAIAAVVEQHEGKINIPTHSIKIEKSTGAPIDGSELVLGIALDKEPAHASMPRSLQKANILLLDTSLEVKDMQADAKVQITDPKQMQAFFDMEEQFLRKVTSQITAAGITFVACQKGIDDLAAYYLAKAGVLAVRRVKKSDMERLSKATGATIVSDLQDIGARVVGHAGAVHERVVGENTMILVEACTNAKAVTILVRGGTEHVVEEVYRAMTDAIGDLKATLESGRAVAGAGACEAALARAVRTYASTLGGRERLAVQAFADSFDVIPRTLAENAGLDPIDVLTELTAAHQKDHTAGVNVDTGKLLNAWEQGIIEPIKIKTQAIQAATEVAVMMLRIDDVIASGEPPARGEPETD